MKTIWKTANKIGIAIWNYPVNGKHTHQHQHLSLFIGEVVHVQQECQHWYYGYRLTNEPNKLGVFPRNYIQIQNDASLDGDNNNYNFEQETILILYEWINLLKKIFENGDMEKYSTVRNLILPLIEKYQLLKSGKLTTSELKKTSNRYYRYNRSWKQTFKFGSNCSRS